MLNTFLTSGHWMKCIMAIYISWQRSKWVNWQVFLIAAPSSRLTVSWIFFLIKSVSGGYRVFLNCYHLFYGLFSIWILYCKLTNSTRVIRLCYMIDNVISIKKGLYELCDIVRALFHTHYPHDYLLKKGGLLFKRFIKLTNKSIQGNQFFIILIVEIVF